MIDAALLMRSEEEAKSLLMRVTRKKTISADITLEKERTLPQGHWYKWSSACLRGWFSNAATELFSGWTKEDEPLYVSLDNVTKSYTITL